MSQKRPIINIVVRADQLRPMMDMRLSSDAVEDEELVRSFREHGIKDALNCRYTDNPDIYEIVDGRRRWKLGQIAGIFEFRITVEDMTDLEAYVVAFIKNDQRKSMNDIEKGYWLKLMMSKFDLSQRGLAKQISKPPSYVNQYVKADDLVSSLPAEQRGLVKSEFQARILSKAPEEKRKEVLETAVVTGALPTGRELERMLTATKEPREVLEKWRFQDDEFIRYTLQEECGMTMTEAANTVINFRAKKLPWQQTKKETEIGVVVRPPDGDPKAEMYAKLGEWYPVNLLDALSLVAPAKSLPTWQNNCRHFIRVLLEKTPVNVKTLIQEEFL